MNRAEAFFALLLVLVPLVPAQESTDPTSSRDPELSGPCVGCHARQVGRLGRVVFESQGSIHDQHDVGCTDCHNGDTQNEDFAHSPSADFVARPRLREVSHFCGECHHEARDRHLGSVHGAQGLPHCITCHGSHGVRRADPVQIITEAACDKCHDYEPARKVRETLTKARALLGDLDSRVSKISHVSAVAEKLDRVRRETRLEQADMISILHRFSLKDMEGLDADVDHLGEVLTGLEQRDVQRREALANERQTALLLGGLLVLVAAGAYLVGRRRGGALGLVSGLGRLAVLLFVLQLATGILLLYCLVSNVPGDLRSVEWITKDASFGWLLHGLHGLGASAILVALLLHGLRLFATAEYKSSRGLQWASGVALLFVVMGMAATGGLLPLLAFHVVALPALLALIFAGHRYLVRRGGRDGQPDEPGPSLSARATKPLMLFAIVVLGLVLLILYGPARTAELPWYQRAWHHSSLLIKPAWLALTLQLGACAVLLAWPVLDRGEARDLRRRPILLAGTVALVLCLVGLSVWSPS